MLNGHFRMDNDFVLSPKLSRKAFLSQDVGKQSQIVIDNAPFITYRLPLQSFYNIPCGVMLYFLNDVLTDVHLFPRWGNESSVSSWSVWSLERQLYAHEKNIEFLRKIYGSAPYIYPWGAIEAVLDEKSGSSSIIIKYQD